MESQKGREPKHKRKTNEEHAVELLFAGTIKPRLVDEHGLSVYTGIFSLNISKTAKEKYNPSKYQLLQNPFM